MPSEYGDNSLTHIRETVSRLRSSVSDISELLSLLSCPLDVIGLLPPAFRQFNNNWLPSSEKHRFQVAKRIPSIQAAILESVVPSWEIVLQEQGYDAILYQYFCPDTLSSSARLSGYTALCAYSSVLLSPLTQFSIKILRRLTHEYPIDRLHSVIYTQDSLITTNKRALTWEEAVRSIVSVPAKVANKVDTLDIPIDLQPHEYYSALCIRFETLVASMRRVPDTEIVQSLNFLLTKLINVGLFPANALLTPSQVSFPAVTLAIVRKRISSSTYESRYVYASIWHDIFASLPSSLYAKALASFFAQATELHDGLDASTDSRGLVKRESTLIRKIFGVLEGTEDEKWLSISSMMLTRTWSNTKARILVCWATTSDEEAVPPRAKETLINRIMEVWSSEGHIKHSLLSHQQYLTITLLLAIYTLPISHPALQSLAFSEAFIGAISRYITHLDPAIRRCGMLTAELVAHRTNKKLDFKQWEGEGEGREWARAVRRLVMQRDADVEELPAEVLKLEPVEIGEGMPESPTYSPACPTITSRIQLVEAAHDSDDDLEGYTSSPASSRSSSPIPSELEELEKDPTINLGKKKIQRPVHLFDLAQLIMSGKKSDDPQNGERIQTALDYAEELIRRKRGFGLELEENAVNLVYLLVGLQNNYELEGFDQKRQAAVSALVACCPRKAAPVLIDEFFKNQYSTDQRFVMLNALAFGARELASLSIPPSTFAADFPSRRLPPALHRKYVAYDETNAARVERLVENISRTAVESGKEASEAKTTTTPIVREKQLRIKQPARIAEVEPVVIDIPTEGTFSKLAAEYFLGPLLGRFWTFMRDEQEREERTVHRKMVYHSTGTGLILSPLVLVHFLGTVAVLIHAARYSPAFLAVLAPDALQLATILGTRPISGAEGEKGREAAVLTAALELAVVILDGSLGLDGGRSLCFEHSPLLLGTGEWAGGVLSALEKGVHVPGEGGVQEVKLRRVAAGVVLKVGELTSRWKQSMISLY